MPRSTIESKDKGHGRRSRVQASRIDGSPAHQAPASKIHGPQASRAETSSTYSLTNQERGSKAHPPQQVPSNKLVQTPQPHVKVVLPRPQAIVVDLLGVMVCRSFMSSSKEFRDYFQHNVLEYLSDSWKVKQLKIMINFFRCSQQHVPDEYKLADREEPKDEQIRQAKKHILWKLRNDPTNSALSLFMLGITEWGYKHKVLKTEIYDEVPHVLQRWKEQAKIPVYVGIGSADFLVMVLSNTKRGNMLPFFNGHMNIMDFDGTRANKDFKKLASLLSLPPDKILYLSRFRQDCKRAMESGMQSAIVLRPDFDTHNLIGQLKAKRANMTSIDGTKMARGGLIDEPASPPPRNGKATGEVKHPDIKTQFENNISSLSLIDDHEETDRYNTQSSTIAEPDLTRYCVVLSLDEIAFK